ncbi:hypothetical protein [Streptomyces filamentosus]|uniref:hypothetical protein n=1 Tax=Streptomyces filamentosus TaxID=67294 RepID=UPI00123C665D|nr:hypothetical protein CP979_23790 [Streptomyces filamentosus]
MISNINVSTAISTAKMTDRSAVSTCSLGLSAFALLGTGLPVAGLPVAGLSGRGTAVVERNERPTKARVAEETKAGFTAYGFAAAGAGKQQTMTQHHTMWAFRGLEPWSDPA